MNKTGSNLNSFKRRTENWNISTSDNDDQQSQLSIAGQFSGSYLSSLEGFNRFNPYLPESTTQGLLECIQEMQTMSCSMSGLNAASLVSLSTSQAIFGCLSMINKYHMRKKRSRNTLLLCADLPQVVEAAVYSNLQVKKISQDQLEQNLDSTVAAIIVDIPNLTADEFVSESTLKLIHEMDIIIYMEGSGQYFYSLKSMPENVSFDLLNLDLGHQCETGSGVYAMLSNDKMKNYLPTPRVQLKENRFSLQTHQQSPFSIGPLNTGVGNIEKILRCYVQLRLKGTHGIQQQAMKAIVAVRYFIKKLADSGNSDACMTTGTSGLCCITINLQVSSKLSLDQGLERYKFQGLYADYVMPDKKGETQFTITLGRLHYLSKTQLDDMIELFIKYL
jgi:glycine cleavage system protein P-like pyridoxal-binding family